MTDPVKKTTGNLPGGGPGRPKGVTNKTTRSTKEAIAANDKYVTSIVDMARFTGDTTDEMSRLVQVADDMFLSQEALNNAMSIGAKKGLDMSVEGIKKLADEYNSLATVQEKNKLLNDNFGRSGLAMGKLLEQGADGITKNMEAIADNLVVTEKSKQITYEYKKSVDSLNDSLDGLKYTLAQETMPALTDVNTILSYYIDKAEGADEKTDKFWKNILRFVPTVYSFVYGFEDAAKALDLWAKKVDDGNYSLDVASKKYQEHRGYIEAVTSARENEAGQLDLVNDAMKELTIEMLYNQAAAGLDSEAALALAAAMGILNINTYNALGNVRSLRGALDAGYISMQNYVSMMGQIAAGPQYGSSYSTPNKPVTAPSTKKPIGKKASGGWGSGLTLVGEQGMELVDLPAGSYVYNNKQTQNIMNGSNTGMSEQQYKGLLGQLQNMNSMLSILPFTMRDAIESIR